MIDRQMTARPAAMEDSALLFAWRNDLQTRLASINSDPVIWEDHVAWLARVLADDSRDLLIVEGPMPVGTVRVDRREGTVFSWTIAPEARGKGWGKAMVRAFCPAGRVTAYIKSENLGSQRIAQAAGFALVHDGELQRWERNRS